MNDYYVLTRYRQQREEALRKAENARLAEEALWKEEAQLRWPRFHALSLVRRLLANVGGPRLRQPPCPDTPLSAH